MNTNVLHDKLIKAAKNVEPDARVPYAFEKRIMARLEALPKVDVWSLWGGALWRATAPCVAIMLLLGVWTSFSVNPQGVPEQVAADLDHTVLAPLDNLGEVW